MKEARRAADAIPLWRQLQAASQVVAGVMAGASATEAIGRIDGALRPGAQALAFAALRQLGRAQVLRRLLVQRPPPTALDALLCTALALCWREADAPYPPFTLVDQAVEAAKHAAGLRRQAGFVNACLRRFLRERESLVRATDGNRVARWNHPDWWIARLEQDHPDAWEQVLRADGRHPPMTLRVNARRTTRESYLGRLAETGIGASAVGEHGVVLHDARPVHAVPGFDEGVVSVQDAAAQVAAPLLLRELDRSRPLRLLDACAAPGGKTAHLLELSDAEVVAIEIDPVRGERVRETLARLGLQATVIAADAARPADWWDGRPFDGILLDAPCTASGIVRRHPDVPWLRREGDIERLAGQQARLLDALWPLLAPDGRLLYCTCSVFRAEGEVQIAAFLSHNSEAVQRPSPGHLLPTPPDVDNALGDNLAGDHDGFFYALLASSRNKPAAPRL